MFNKINDAYDSVRNGLDAQIALATAEQKELLADAKLSLADLKSLIADLKDENRLLKDQIRQRQEYVLEAAVYWQINDIKREQPFCPGCYASGKIVPMKPDKPNTKITTFLCPVCANRANPHNYIRPAYTRSKMRSIRNTRY